jgi:CheY-like chemotaxis protein
MMLKRAGFGTIDLVEDGQAAVDFCRALGANDQPRIIFMDNTMPRLVRSDVLYFTLY